MSYDNLFIDKKAIKSGNMVEVWEYERPSFRRPPVKSKFAMPYSDEERERWTKKNKMNSFHRMLRLVTQNFQGVNSYFITLTFKDNVQFVEEANKQFKLFIQRLRRKLKKDIKYIATIEFQDKSGRGAVHYHMLANTGFIKNTDLYEVWGQGYVRINRVKDTMHAASYAGKYMKKGIYDARLAGKKSFFCSQNLSRPLELINGKVDKLLEAIKEVEKVTYTDTTYESEYNGQIAYKKYFLSETLTIEAPKTIVAGSSD